MKGMMMETLREDEVKRKLKAWLEGQGWITTVVWGKRVGWDIEAQRNGVSWLIEVKGRTAAMRVDYLTGLGWLVQRMSDPNARYSLALADTPMYRRLWSQLAAVGKSRLQISALFVHEVGRVEEVS